MKQLRFFCVNLPVSKGYRRIRDVDERVRVSALNIFEIDVENLLVREAFVAQPRAELATTQSFPQTAQPDLAVLELLHPAANNNKQTVQ